MPRRSLRRRRVIPFPWSHSQPSIPLLAGLPCRPSETSASSSGTGRTSPGLSLGFLPDKPPVHDPVLPRLLALFHRAKVLPETEMKVVRTHPASAFTLQAPSQTQVLCSPMSVSSFQTRDETCGRIADNSDARTTISPTPVWRMSTARKTSDPEPHCELAARQPPPLLPVPIPLRRRWLHARLDLLPGISFVAVSIAAVYLWLHMLPPSPSSRDGLPSSGGIAQFPATPPGPAETEDPVGDILVPVSPSVLGARQEFK